MPASVLIAISTIAAPCTNNADLEDPTLACELADLRSQHHERGDEQRVDEQRRRGRRRRRVQVFGHRPERHRQDGDVDRHLQLCEDDDDQRQPGRLHLASFGASVATRGIGRRVSCS
jgi:hypothetical protein